MKPYMVMMGMKLPSFPTSRASQFNMKCLLIIDVPSGEHSNGISLFFNRIYIFKESMFHYYVSLPGCTWIDRFIKMTAK